MNPDSMLLVIDALDEALEIFDRQQGRLTVPEIRIQTLVAALRLRLSQSLREIKAADQTRGRTPAEVESTLDQVLPSVDAAIAEFASSSDDLTASEANAHHMLNTIRGLIQSARNA